MMKQDQRIEHAEFSLKRGTAMREKFRNNQENPMFYNGKVLLVKCFKNSLADKRKLKKSLIDTILLISKKNYLCKAMELKAYIYLRLQSQGNLSPTKVN